MSATSSPASDRGGLGHASVLQAILRTDFPAFLQKVFNELCPGDQFLSGWHLSAIAYQLEQIEKGDLRRLVVVQGDTEPASVEQQRHLCLTAPSLYDLQNLFQMNVEESRHL